MKSNLSYHITSGPVNPYWLEEDIKHLERMIKFQNSPESLKKKLGEENWYLWEQKVHYEKMLLDDLYNLEINFKIYAYELGILRRISIIRAQNKLKDKKVKHTYEAFTIYPQRALLNEMTHPITEEISLQRPLKTYGRGYFHPSSRPAGKMKVILVKEHDEALYHWLKDKERSQIPRKANILIHFDAHSDMSLIEDDDIQYLLKIKKLKELKRWFASFYYQEKNADQIRSPINLTTYLHYAVKTGLLGEIFWVMPDPDFCKLRLATNLKKSFLLEIDGGNNFRAEHRHIICHWEGIKVHILRICDLPVFKESVILDIDMDYFLNEDSGSNEYGWHGYRIQNENELTYWNQISGKSMKIGDIKPWITLENFYQFLLIKNILTSSVTISLSPFYTLKDYHIIADKLADLLSNG